MTRNVVITGLGAVSGFGLSVDAFWQGLSSGASAIKSLNGEAQGTSIKVGAIVPGYDPSLHFSSSDQTLFDKFSQFAVIAAREAITDAGLSEGDEMISRAAAIIGTGCGGKQTDEETYLQLYKNQRKRVHPLTIPQGMPSAAASAVSMQLGIMGPVFSITSACASGAHAIAQGYSMIKSGMAEVVVVGGTDTPFTYGLLKSWEALRVLSDDTCRPFSKDRRGLVLAEGAGMTVLESEQHAKQRNAKVYAQLTGCGMTADADHVTRPNQASIMAAITAALQQAGLTTSDIDYINAHGTGTQLNDRIETAAIKEVFGQHAMKLAVSSTKSMHGHAMGASSALEFIATVLTLSNQLIPPTANYSEADPECDLDYVPNDSRSETIDTAISNSFAFGGLNTVLALSRY